VTLSPFLALFWICLTLAAIAAVHSRNHGLITAAVLLVVHQAIGLTYSLTLQSKTIYEVYGILCFVFFALSAYVWRGSIERWKVYFTGGFIAMISVNWVGAVLNTQSIVLVWIDTFILYAMIGLIVYRWSRERRSRFGRPAVVRGSTVRPGLVTPRTD